MYLQIEFNGSGFYKVPLPQFEHDLTFSIEQVVPVCGDETRALEFLSDDLYQLRFDCYIDCPIVIKLIKGDA